MMQRFVYLSDSHYAATPISRKDNYNEAVLKKLIYIFELARKNKAIILFGGDLVDSPKIKLFELNNLIKVFIEYADVPFYAIFGNAGHDGLLESSPVSLLKMAKFIKGDGLFQDFDDCRVIFCHSGMNITEMNKYVHVDKFNVLMTHHTLVQEPVIFEHDLISTIDTEADLITIGHYHPYQGIIKRKDGKIFVAPGSIGRKKRTKEDMNRIIKCAYFSVEDKKLKTLKEIEIPCNMDIWVNKKVLDIDDELLYNDIESSVSDMKSLLKNQAIFPSLEDGLTYFANEKKLDEKVKTFVMERIKHV